VRGLAGFTTGLRNSKSLSAGIAYYSLGIPAMLNAYSGRSPNGIPGRSRTPSERSDAGISIVPEVFGFVKRNLPGETCPERSEGRSPLAEKGVRGKGQQPLSLPQHAVARSASALRQYDSAVSPIGRHWWPG